jgi:hypothetical protein
VVVVVVVVVAVGGVKFFISCMLPSTVFVQHLKYYLCHLSE